MGCGLRLATVGGALDIVQQARQEQQTATGKDRRGRQRASAWTDDGGESAFCVKPPSGGHFRRKSAL